MGDAQPRVDPFRRDRGPAVGSVQWADQPQPWLRLSIDDVVWNADVGDYLRASGV